MKKLRGWITLILGILLVLPLIGVNQLGTLTEGILAWIIALGILVMGIHILTKGYKE